MEQFIEEHGDGLITVFIAMIGIGSFMLIAQMLYGIQMQQIETLL